MTFKTFADLTPEPDENLCGDKCVNCICAREKSHEGIHMCENQHRWSDAVAKYSGEW